MSSRDFKHAPLPSIAKWPSVPGADANTLAACCQCGSVPIEIEEAYKPEIVIFTMNLGEPYQHAVHCRVCGRIAAGVGEAAAVKAWNDNDHQFDSL